MLAYLKIKPNIVATFAMLINTVLFSSIKDISLVTGVIEAGCKTVVGKKTKQSVMFWKVAGAQNILDVRCSVISGTYDQYWINRRCQQINQLKIAA